MTNVKICDGCEKQIDEKQEKYCWVTVYYFGDDKEINQNLHVHKECLKKINIEWS